MHSNSRHSRTCRQRPDASVRQDAWRTRLYTRVQARPRSKRSRGAHLQGDLSLHRVVGAAGVDRAFHMVLLEGQLVVVIHKDGAAGHLGLMFIFGFLGIIP